MNQSTQEEVLDLEKKVVELEGRKASAEVGLTTASEAKKRIEGDVTEMQATLKLGKELIEKNKEEINLTGQKIVEIQDSVRKEDQAFEESKKAHALSLEESQKELDGLAGKKNTLLAEIHALSKSHANDRIAKEGEIKELERKESHIVSQIRILDKEKAELIEKTALVKTELEGLEKDLVKKKKETLTAESSLTSLVNECENQKGIINNNSILIAQQNEDIENKNKEILDLEGKIVIKTEELEKLQAKAFAILKREEAIIAKENLIRHKYEKAGIPFEE